MNQARQYQGGVPALIGGAWGLVGALALAALRTVLSMLWGVPFPFNLPGDAVFGALYVMPFALTLAALWWGSPAQRAAAWAAGTILAVMVSFTAFSGVSLIFLPAAPLLLLATLRTIRGRAVRQSALAMGFALVLVLLNAGAFGALFLTQDGVCWQRVRAADGQESWQSAPYSNTGSISASGEGVQEIRCDSDTFSATELLVSSTLLTLTAAVWMSASRLPRPGTSKSV
jgi:hypothetical protein